jgi:hypothetical protein
MMAAVLGETRQGDDKCVFWVEMSDADVFEASYQVLLFGGGGTSVHQHPRSQEHRQKHVSNYSSAAQALIFNFKLATVILKCRMQ